MAGADLAGAGLGESALAAGGFAGFAGGVDAVAVSLAGGEVGAGWGLEPSNDVSTGAVATGAVAMVLAPGVISRTT